MMSDPLRVGVLGAGVMGSGIAQVTATAGCPTVCHDVDPDALARGLSLVTTGRYGLARGVERGKLTQAQADAALGRLRFTGALEERSDGQRFGRGDVSIRMPGERHEQRATPGEPCVALVVNELGLTPVSELVVKEREVGVAQVLG